MKSKTQAVTIRRVVGTELHHQYPSQDRPQPCHVWLDLDARRMGAEADGEIGNAVPERVWTGHVQRIPIRALSADDANALLDAIAPLAARVCDGAESRWDGNRHVARLDADAEAALAAIESECASAGPALVVMSAREWFDPLGDRARQRAELEITSETTDDEIEALAERERVGARDSQGIDLLEDVEGYLTELRDETRQGAT